MIKEIYLAGGCFWGTQLYLKQIKGVLETEVGYANGNTPDPTYKEVYTDETGYAETVYVKYDSEIISLERILQLYFKSIDPLSLNKQGGDIGTRYRTGIYYTDAEDLPVIQKVFGAVEQECFAAGRSGQQSGACRLAVEVKPLKNFYTGEEYHQNYLDKNPDGYCHISAALMEYVRQQNK